MKYKIGQKVVCIDNVPTKGRFWAHDIPVVGRVYTVSGFTYSLYDDSLCLRLEEIQNISSFKRDDLGYRAVRFRPVAEKKTDISALQRLTKVKELECIT
jgi:hypothetical protein